MREIERKGEVTAVGTQVGQNDSAMYIEIDKFRIDFPEGSIVTVKVKLPEIKKEIGGK